MMPNILWIFIQLWFKASTSSYLSPFINSGDPCLRPALQSLHGCYFHKTSHCKCKNDQGQLQFCSHRREYVQLYSLYMDAIFHKTSHCKCINDQGKLQFCSHRRELVCVCVCARARVKLPNFSWVGYLRQSVNIIYCRK